MYFATLISEISKLVSAKFKDYKAHTVQECLLEFDLEKHYKVERKRKKREKELRNALDMLVALTGGDTNVEHIPD